jgi:hypothetical protein
VSLNQSAASSQQKATHISGAAPCEENKVDKRHRLNESLQKQTYILVFKPSAIRLQYIGFTLTETTGETNADELQRNKEECDKYERTRPAILTKGKTQI